MLRDRDRERNDHMIHVVQRGETLFQIAKQYDMPVGELIRANPELSVSGLVVGLNLRVPASSPRTEVAMLQEQTECRGGKFYQVQQESLVGLMEITGLSFAALLCANPGIDFSGSLDGKLICIPNHDAFNSPVTKDLYVVRTDDNIDVISRRVGLPAYELIRLNPSMTIADYTQRGTPVGIPALRADQTRVVRHVP